MINKVEPSPYPQIFTPAAPLSKISRAAFIALGLLVLCLTAILMIKISASKSINRMPPSPVDVKPAEIEFPPKVIKKMGGKGRIDSLPWAREPMAVRTDEVSGAEKLKSIQQMNIESTAGLIKGRDDWNCPFIILRRVVLETKHVPLKPENIALEIEHAKQLEPENIALEIEPAEQLEAKNILQVIIYCNIESKKPVWWIEYSDNLDSTLSCQPMSKSLLDLIVGVKLTLKTKSKQMNKGSYNFETKQ